MKYFYLDESPVYKGKYVMRMNHELFNFPHGTTGSFQVFASRVLNLSYAQYLRYCRDRVGAELIGKGKKYVIPLFDLTQEAQLLEKLLNKRLEYIMNEREFPFNYIKENGEVIRTPLEK